MFLHWKDSSWSGFVTDELFKGYQGVIQPDGYEVYSRFENMEDIVLLECIAHVRCKFRHLATDDENVAHIIETIATFYESEGNLRHKKAPFREAEMERKAKTYPTLKHSETYMLNVHK